MTTTEIRDAHIAYNAANRQAWRARARARSAADQRFNAAIAASSELRWLDAAQGPGEAREVEYRLADVIWSAERDLSDHLFREVQGLNRLLPHRFLSWRR